MSVCFGVAPAGSEFQALTLNLRDTARGMAQENIELAKKGIAAISEAYAKDDIAPWRQQVGKLFDPEVVLEAGTDAFTEGEWRGQEGAVQFVANQMEVLKEMWMRLDDFINVDEDCFIVGITFGGQALRMPSASSEPCGRSAWTGY